MQKGIGSRPTLADIEAAAARLDGAIMKTPCVVSRTLSAILGCELYLKLENLQFTASFKERGALNKLSCLSEGERRQGVCAMSAGNHAQGVAYHARRLAIPATIVMPRGTPLTKISRTREHGARVVVDGANLTEARAIAHRIADEEQLIFIHPYDDPLVIAGQGTIGLEILREIEGLDAIIVPIGGGGLISGIATAIKAIRPTVRVVGVQSKTYPSMVRTLAGDDVPCADGITIAEGIAVKSAGHLTRQIVSDHVDEILLVEENSIERAIALLLSIEKTVVEGAGAAGLAAILDYRERFSGLRVVAPLTGGNIDLSVVASVAMRELVRSNRLLRMEVPISDSPGTLAVVTGVIGELGANIVRIEHDRLSLALTPKGTVVDIVLEVEDLAHGEAVREALRSRDFDACII